MKFGTKTQFGMLALVIALAYVFWIEILGGVLYLYTFTDNPTSKRLLAEYYANLSNENSKKATRYFQEALEDYKIKLPGTPIEQKRWIEYIIGNQYEYGKGVPKDLATARMWYQKAIRNGFPKGKTLMDQLIMSLSNVKPNNENKKEDDKKDNNTTENKNAIIQKK